MLQTFNYPILGQRLNPKICQGGTPLQKKGEEEGIGAYGWETRKGNNIQNVNKKFQLKKSQS